VRRELRPIDRFQIATTVVIGALGCLILARAALSHAPIDSYGLGAAFLGYALYRARFIVRVLRGEGGPS